jgi:hypothetical protein
MSENLAATLAWWAPWTARAGDNAGKDAYGFAEGILGLGLGDDTRTSDGRRWRASSRDDVSVRRTPSGSDVRARPGGRAC